MSVKARLLAASLIVTSVTVTASADMLLRGDIVSAIRFDAVICPTTPSVLVLASDLQRKNGPYAGGAVAVDGSGHIYVLENNNPPWVDEVVSTTLDVFDTSFQKVRTIALPENARSIAVDGNGTAYVVAETGKTRVYSPAGDFVRMFILPDVAAAPAPLSLDISSDHCTLAYLGAQGSANRFDACSLTALPSIGEGFDAVRALADGGVVAAIGGRIRIYDGRGLLVADYASPTSGPVTALALGADGSSLWVAAHKQLFQIHFAGGAVRDEAVLDFVNVRFLAVFGESRPAAVAAMPSKRRSIRH